ncbi:MAG TPA: oxaloacetate decarboxylase subunit alpha, partial [Candidatus Atribacteria bacterium]|nr:oxaloacetate decarboxylase subunit alpha [Candidatus Atribacteria bacterium]
LEKARKELNGYMEKEEDILTYALFPQVALKFFRDREAKKYKIDLDYWDSIPDKEYVYPV